MTCCSASTFIANWVGAFKVALCWINKLTKIKWSFCASARGILPLCLRRQSIYITIRQAYRQSRCSRLQWHLHRSFAQLVNNHAGYTALRTTIRPAPSDESHLKWNVPSSSAVPSVASKSSSSRALIVAPGSVWISILCDAASSPELKVTFSIFQYNLSKLV